MFCKNCGTELVGTEIYCDGCGEPVQAVRSKPEAMGTSRPGEPHTSNLCGYTSFEYARTTVREDLAQVACDCYESLGYELTGQCAEAPHNRTTLSFRRGRAIRSKAQLAKIQREMDDGIASIASLEAAKTRKATIQALVIGIIAALVLGVGMCCSMVWTQFMVPGIVIGVAGIIGCVYAYVRYRKVCEIEAAQANPRIAEIYDHLATSCEEAQALLVAS